MKRIQFFVATVLALLVSSVAPAATAEKPAGTTAVPLASISNDRDASISNIELVLNKRGTVRGIYLETHPGRSRPQAQVKGRMYSLAGIESADGVVLGQGQGVKAIYLRGSIPTHGDHGSLVIRYLANGIFRHYKECRIGLERQGPGDWQLVNAYNGHPITRIKVQTWALGISTIANVCPKRAA